MRVILPGAVSLRPIKITVNKLDQEMVDWWILQGAEAQEIDRKSTRLNSSHAT
jgi:hypothetical protein